MVSCIASATSSSFFRYAEATLYMLCTCSSISRQNASLSPFFAFRIKNSFIVVSILLYLTGRQEMLCKSFVYVLLLIRRAKHQKGCRFFHKNFRMQKSVRSPNSMSFRRKALPYHLPRLKNPIKKRNPSYENLPS